MARAYLMAACSLLVLLVTVYCETYQPQVQPPPDATDAAIEGPSREKRQTFGDYGTDYNAGGGCGRNRSRSNDASGGRMTNRRNDGSNGRNRNNNLRNRRFNSTQSSFTGEFTGEQFRQRMNATFGGAVQRLNKTLRGGFPQFNRTFRGFNGARGFAAAGTNKMPPPMLPAPGSQPEEGESSSLPGGPPVGALPPPSGGFGGPSPQALKPVAPISPDSAEDATRKRRDAHLKYFI